jgi:peptidoglycan/LPS O-acetylase OafA/YrhL
MHRRNLYYKAPMLFQTTAIYILLQSGWVLKNAVNTVGAIADITWGALFFFIMLLYINKNKIRSMNHWQRGIALATATGGYIFIIICVEHLRFIPDMTLFYIQISLTLLMFAIGLYWSQLDIFSICNMLLQWFYRFGKISYSIYIIHQPILMIIIFILLQFGDPAVLVVLFVPAILYLAWFLELRYQPFMLSILNPLAIRLGMMPRDKTIS